MKPLRFTSIAELELMEAAEFYEQRQRGLGRKLLDAVHVAANRVQQNPEMWSRYGNGLRSHRVMTYPYRLIYRDLTDRIEIIAVAHLSRRPRYWKDRL